MCFCVLYKRNDKSRGFGFVSFLDPQDFIKALKEMNGNKVRNWIESTEGIKPLFTNRNDSDRQSEEEGNDFYTMLEEKTFTPTMGGNQFLTFDKAMSDITDEINAFDTAKVKLTMKSANGDMLYLFQNSIRKHKIVLIHSCKIFAFGLCYLFV